MTPMAPLAAALALALLAPLSAAQQPQERAARFYEDALTRYERKDVSGAIIQLKNALQIDKTLLPVQVLLGRALLANGEAAAAEIAINEALRLGVNRAEVALPLAQAMLAQGKHAQFFEQARLNPAGLPHDVRQQLLLLRARAYSELGQPDNAIQSVEQARALDPASAESWIAEVPIRLRAADYTRASQAADRALALAPQLAEALYQRATVIHLQAETQAALSAYAQALQADPGHVEARLARAGLLLDLSRDAEARVDVTALLERSAREPRAIYLKALLAERAGDVAGARAALREVVALLDPVPIEFIRYRPQLLLLNGLAHFSLHELLKAKPYLEGFQRSQASSPVSKLLGQIYMQENNPERAIEVLEAYLRSFPGDGQALTQLATAHMVRGRHGRATALMQEALKSKDSPEFRAVLGLSLMRGGDSAKALAELETAFKKDPGQTEAGMNLVALLLRQGLVERALPIAESLSARQAGNATLVNLLGVVKAQSGDLVGARQAFERSLLIDTKALAPQLGLARIEIAERAWDAAERRLQGLLKIDERNTEALFDLAVLAERRGRPDDALRWLEKAVDFSLRQDTRANFALVDFHLRAGRAAQALDAARVLLAKAPEDAAALISYARAQSAAGDTAGARQTLSNASRRGGFDAELLTTVASLQAATNDLAGAAYSLDKALSARPDHLRAMALMNEVELRQGDPSKAEARARRIIQSRPKLALGHQLLGDVMLSRAQLPAALEAYRQAQRVQASSHGLLNQFHTLQQMGSTKVATQLAEQWIKNHPNDFPVRRALANAFAGGGDFVRARREFEALLKLAPGDGETLNNLANVLLHLKDPAAVKMAEESLARSPNNPAAIDTLGWVLFNNGEAERALQLLRDARLRDPDNAEIRYHLAAVLAKVGRRAEAREELRVALSTTRRFDGRSEADKLLQTLK